MHLAGMECVSLSTSRPWCMCVPASMRSSGSVALPVRIPSYFGWGLFTKAHEPHMVCPWSCMANSARCAAHVLFGASLVIIDAPGDLPKLSKWKTQLTLFENDRELPSAKLKSTHNWAPATPKTNMPATFASTGPKSGKTFAVPFVRAWF